MARLETGHNGRWGWPEFAAPIAPSGSGNAHVEADHFLQSLSPVNKWYVESLFHKLTSPTPTIRIGITGVDRFQPTALTPEDQVRKEMNVTDFQTRIKGSRKYKDVAQKTHVTMHDISGGIATNFERNAFLKHVYHILGRSDQPQYGAKSTDIYFPLTLKKIDYNGNRELSGMIHWVSVFEMKMLQYIAQADDFAGFDIRELVNNQSLPSIEKAFDSPYLPDVLDERIPQKRRRTYRSIIEKKKKMNIGEPYIQVDLPTIDQSTKRLTNIYQAPGGHGNFGALFFHEMSDPSTPIPNTPRVRVVANGDGPNNTVSPEMVGFTVAEKAGIVMLTATKTRRDIKGGILGVQHSETGLPYPQIMELAQAKKGGQADVFHGIGTENPHGLSPEEAQKHRPDGQLINTNTIIMNETLLIPFLQRVRTQLGDDAFAEAISPDLILNMDKPSNGKLFTQLEGAIGSVCLNLNKLVLTNPQVKKIWQEISGTDVFLRIINLDKQDMDEYFTPEKYPVDHAIFAQTNHYKYDQKKGKLVNRLPGHTIYIGDEIVGNPYYKDIYNAMRAFEGADVLRLDSLEVKGVQKTDDSGKITIVGGQVNFTGCILEGTVEVICNQEREFKFNTDEVKRILSTGEHHRTHRHSDGRILLKNIRIIIDQGGGIQIQKIPITVLG